MKFPVFTLFANSRRYSPPNLMVWALRTMENTSFEVPIRFATSRSDTGRRKNPLNARHADGGQVQVLRLGVCRPAAAPRRRANSFSMVGTRICACGSNRRNWGAFAEGAIENGPLVAVDRFILVQVVNCRRAGPFPGRSFVIDAHLILIAAAGSHGYEVRAAHIHDAVGGPQGY